MRIALKRARALILRKPSARGDPAFPARGSALRSTGCMTRR